MTTVVQKQHTQTPILTLDSLFNFNGTNNNSNNSNGSLNPLASLFLLPTATSSSTSSLSSTTDTNSNNQQTINAPLSNLFQTFNAKRPTLLSKQTEKIQIKAPRPSILSRASRPSITPSNSIC